jgi:hypothetical protein
VVTPSYDDVASIMIDLAAWPWMVADRFGVGFGQFLGGGGCELGCRFGIRTDSVEGRIRADSGGFRAAPQGIVHCGIVHSVWAFRPYLHEFRIRTDSVESRIRTDSDGFQDPEYGSRQSRL